MTRPNCELGLALIVLMSIATGLAVVSNYYIQPLLDTIARNFSLSTSLAGFIVTAIQLGYTAGLLSLVLLGDMSERHRLIISTTLLAASGMLTAANSQSLAMVVLSMALTGLFSAVTRILVPLAAAPASSDKRGKVVGTIMSGLLLGILFARTVAGLLTGLGGWRTVFWVALVLMALMALALWCGLLQMKSEAHPNYPRLLGSVFSMFISDRVLRIRALLDYLAFANFDILWISTAFLLAAPPFSYSDGVIGLFGFAGAAGASGTRPTGDLADKDKPHHTTTFGLPSLLFSWLAIWFGHASILVLIIGILVLGLTVQGVHIINRTVTYQIHPDTHNRLTVDYITNCSIGGAADSLISASAWQHGSRVGVCLAGVTTALVNLLVRWRGLYHQEVVS